MTTTSPYPFDGPADLEQPVLQALSRVVDPEVALTIVDVGLVYGVCIDGAKVHVKLTMTSAACPVADLILEEAETELDRVLPPHFGIDVELVWEPPWTPERMSARARQFMQG